MKFIILLFSLLFTSLSYSYDLKLFSKTHGKGVEYHTLLYITLFDKFRWSSEPSICIKKEPVGFENKISDWKGLYKTSGEYYGTKVDVITSHNYMPGFLCFDASEVEHLKFFVEEQRKETDVKDHKNKAKKSLNIWFDVFIGYFKNPATIITFFIMLFYILFFHDRLTKKIKESKKEE